MIYTTRNLAGEGKKRSVVDAYDPNLRIWRGPTRPGITQVGLSGYRMTPGINPMSGTDRGLNGLFDDLFGNLKASAGARLKKEFQSQLDSAQAKLESKMGAFLSSNQQVRELKARAQTQQNASNKDAASRATAIVNKADGLLSQYQSIQTAALSLASQLAALKTSIQTSEVFNFSDPLTAGTRIVELFNQNKSAVLNAVQSATSVYTRMNNHLKAVDGLASDVNGLESFAQGKGLEALAGKVGGAYLDTFKVPLMIVAAGAAIWMFAPSLIGRSVKSAVRS